MRDITGWGSVVTIVFLTAAAVIYLALSGRKRVAVFMLAAVGGERGGLDPAQAVLPPAPARSRAARHGGVHRELPLGPRDDVGHRVPDAGDAARPRRAAGSTSRRFCSGSASS